MPLTVELACADHDPGGYWFTIENWEHGTIRQHIQDSKFRADEAIPLVTERLARKQPEYGPLVSFTREITPELEADLATVVKLVQRRPGLSFVELTRLCLEFHGDLSWWFNDSLMLWAGLNERAMRAMNYGVYVDALEVEPCSTFVYLIDGFIPNMPEARSLTRHYQKPRWVPVVFNLGKLAGKYLEDSEANHA